MKAENKLIHTDHAIRYTYIKTGSDQVPVISANQTLKHTGGVSAFNKNNSYLYLFILTRWSVRVILTLIDHLVNLQRKGVENARD